MKNNRLKIKRKIKRIGTEIKVLLFLVGSITATIFRVVIVETIIRNIQREYVLQRKNISLNSKARGGNHYNFLPKKIAVLVHGRIGAAVSEAASYLIVVTTEVNSILHEIGPFLMFLYSAVNESYDC